MVDETVSHGASLVSFPWGGWMNTSIRGMKGAPAIPPLLQFRAEPLRKQGENSSCGPEVMLQQLNGIAGAALAGQVRHKAATDPPPTGLFAAPLQATTGPGQLFPVKQPTARAKNPEAVLTARAGVLTAVGKQGTGWSHRSGLR